MSKKRSKAKGRKSKKAARRFALRQPAESRGAEVLTIAWTVALTTVVLCDLVAVAAHLYVAAFPAAPRMQLLEGLMLFGGSVIGVVCLALVPVVYRVRRLPPPPGIVIFGVLVALAPILATVAHLVQAHAG